MNLTKENKAKIDGMTYRQLLAAWRFAKSGDPWFQGETGKYWDKRMAELKAKDPTQAVADSKAIGWS